MKKFLSMMLVVTMVMSIMPLNVLALDTVKAVKPVQSMEGGKIKIYEKDGWTYSVSEGEENIVLVAVSPEDMVYQKLVDKNEKISTSDLSVCFDDLSSMQQFDMSSPNTASTASISVDVDDLKPLLLDVEGNAYTTEYFRMRTYNGKTFRVEEIHDLNYPMPSDKVIALLERDMSVATVLTYFSNHGIGLGVATLCGMYGLAQAIDTIIDFNSTLEAYYCSGVYIRATYSTEVSYVLESTSKTNEYVIFADENENIDPVIEYQYTTYQHGPSYFEDIDAQVENAYENYYGN